ncbi:Transposase [Gimesia panareensis]|uniref:Transposase n=1 Tax=Gimesia panareensis TaxID=2527978 RepID=A0A518ABZ3_9PLAN|nr:Transposase [Gimesia panareensis]QDU52249.1 Transposase [Gimesia panareensis]
MSRNSKSSASKPKISRRVYSREFKLDAVRLVSQEGYSLAAAARSLGVHVSQIRKWKEKFMPQGKESSSLTEDEKAELKRLRAENRRLKMERDILKKATVFFAKENQ